MSYLNVYFLCLLQLSIYQFSLCLDQQPYGIHLVFIKDVVSVHNVSARNVGIGSAASAVILNPENATDFTMYETFSGRSCVLQRSTALTDSTSSIGFVNEFEFAVYKNFTFSAWLYPTVIPVAGQVVIIGFKYYQYINVNYAPMLYLIYSQIPNYFRVCAESAVSNGWCYPVNMPINEWFHVGLVYTVINDPVNGIVDTAVLYINGVRAGAPFFFSNRLTNASPYLTMFSTKSSPVSYQGYISDVIINRTSFSDSSMVSVYQTTTTDSCGFISDSSASTLSSTSIALIVVAVLGFVLFVGFVAVKQNIKSNLILNTQHLITSSKYQQV